MPAANASPAHPLSPLQEGMLSHQPAGGMTGVDLVQIEMNLPEALPVSFGPAWAWLAARHAILRTAFRWAGNPATPGQVVADAITPDISREDWTHLGARAREQRWQQLLAEDRARGFDLTVAPLWRVTIADFGPRHHRVLFTFHHLLLDGRAVVVLLQELFVVTEALAAGQEPMLGPPVPYAGYLGWLQEQDTSASASYWRAAFAGFRAPTPLPAAGAARTAGATGPAQRTQTLSVMRTGALHAFAAAHGLTMNTLVQGAWALLLSRYSGEEEVVFGAVRACRHGSVPGADKIVGLLINTVPLRVAVPAGETVAAWLRGLRQQWIDLRAHEHTPLALVRRECALPAGAPLFETFVSYQEPSWDAALRAQGGAWSQRTFGIHNHTSQPLALDAAGGPALKLTLTYDSARYEERLIQRMLGHLATLLDQMAADPDRVLGELPMLTTAEENALLRLGCPPPVAFDDSLCVHHLVEEQVALTPLATAVADERQTLTYADLNARANRIARHLHLLGVGPGAFVGVCLQPSVELVVAFLAVLKAGGAYVPLDPAYPRDRLEFLVRDAGLKILLTESSLTDRLPGALQRILVDAPAPRTVQSLAIRSATLVSPQDPAYLIYTSGSTGQPKGVPIRHRSLANLVAWHRDAYRVTPSDRATQLASPAFDACVWELWPYLAAGASVHLVPREVRPAPARLVRWLADQRITLCFLPTPLAEAVMDESWPAETTLRAILTGGDRLRRWPGDRLPCPLINHYGPTECTVLATAAEVPAADEGAPAIGRPTMNAEVLVLDRERRLVPVGVAGELHLGGAGLAEGYHHRPELTAEKFIRHPFDHTGRLRLYRTGDIVRWREDGQLDYLGRADEQVKIRGHRIEPAEIEAALAAHPAVRECLVTCREDAGAEPRLAAYVIAAPGAAVPAGSELASFLHLRLPAYMVPSAFVPLPAWPLTPNGKIDRRQLPAPDFAATGERAVAPKPGVESVIADAWCEVLGRRELSASDDFFQLGGHSLRAAQVVSRLNHALGLTLSVRHLFDHSTITSLAAAIGPLLRAKVPAAPGIREMAQRC